MDRRGQGAWLGVVAETGGGDERARRGVRRSEKLRAPHKTASPRARRDTTNAQPSDAKAMECVQSVSGDQVMETAGGRGGCVCEKGLCSPLFCARVADMRRHQKSQGSKPGARMRVRCSALVGRNGSRGDGVGRVERK